MPKQFRFISSGSVVSKVIRDSGITDINKEDIIEWVGEVLQAIGTQKIKQEYVMFLEVKDHTAELPSEVQEVVKVYRNHQYDNGDCVTPLEVAVGYEPEAVEVKPVKCGSDIIPDEDLPTWTRRFETHWEHLDWSNGEIRTKKFAPMALSSAIMFQGVVCDGINSGITTACTDEYRLSNGVITTSFRTGQIAIAYRTTPVDEDGYPLVPDLYSVQTAITNYILYKTFARQWYQGREGFSDKMQWADKEYQFYIKQAKNDTWGLHGIDEHQNMINFKKSPFGRQSFDNLGRPSSIYPKGLNNE